MLASLKEYLPAVLRGFVFSLVIGGVGGAVGLILDAVPSMTMPLWGWATVGVLALSAAQFGAFHKVREQRDAYRPDQVNPDWGAHRVFGYIRSQSAWSYQPAYQDEQPPIEAINIVRQAALDEDVTVWGRPTEKPNAPLDRIDRDFWKENNFLAREVLIPPGSAGSHWTEPDDPSRQPRTFYRDLQFNKRQVMLRWPKLSLYRRVQRAID